MNIVLVDAPADKNFLTLGYHPHPGLAYLAASLEENGHEVSIVDSVSSNKNVRQMIKQIIKLKPHIVGFTATTAARFQAIDIINSVKKITNAFIVAGGSHFHPTAIDAMSKISAIDSIVKGEGERTIVEIAQAVEAKESISEINGIFFRKNGEVIETPDRPLNENLDSLPRPAYHLFNLKGYKIRVRGSKNVPGLGVISSRGCPCRCTFCSITALKKHKFRKRSPELFLDEVAYFKKTYGYNGFVFNDDTITMDRNHIVTICNGILKRKMNICWSALARANTVDQDLLLLMKSAGCCCILYGIESGSDITLNSLRKGITVGQAIKAMEMTERIGIPFDAMFMVSLPGETIQELSKTIDLIKKISSYHHSRVSYGFTCIFPGTEIENLAYKEGILPNNFSWNKQYLRPVYAVLGSDPSTPCWETPLLPLKDIKALIFKTRPLSYKIQHIFDKLRICSPRSVISALQIGIRVFNIRQTQPSRRSCKTLVEYKSLNKL